MSATDTTEAMREHFAHCIQVLGGVTASSRRLQIDERALRRFISGERPLGAGLMTDAAKALRALAVEANAAEEQATALLGLQNIAPETPAP